MMAAALGMAALLLWWLAARDAVGFAVFALAFGAFYGTYVALIPALTTDYFGGRNAGGIIGVLYLSVGLGALVGPSVAGYTYDLVGSYTPAILFTVAGNLIAALCLLALPDALAWRAAGSTAMSAPEGRLRDGVRS
jgi:MFS family permease